MPTTRLRCRHLRPTSSPHHRRGDSVRAKVAAPRFPGGRRRAEVPVPCLLVEVDAGDVGGEGGGGVVARAVEEGANVVCIQGGKKGELYTSTVAARAAVRGEEVLVLVGDDAGAAAAAGADGVLLSEDGVPTIAAKRLLGGSAASIVGRMVKDLAGAEVAVDEGADFVVVCLEGGGALELVREVKERTSVPVLIGSGGEGAKGVADGIVVRSGGNVEEGKIATIDLGNLIKAEGDIESGSNPDICELAAGSEGEEDGTHNISMGAAHERGREGGGDPLMIDEKDLLARILSCLESSSYEMEELSVFRDGIAALDSLFLLVIVGEFNSGKSTVINAMLGKTFLESGILPTTNEIALLRYGDAERCTMDKDGRLIREVPAKLLRTMDIVDTPGTNVILERQQRLTEEFVPRSDLVIFVLSADRPFSESEVKFMKYIKQWGKKILFVVNKIDLLGEEEEIRQVEEFVRRNVSRVLGVAEPRVLTMSARKALKVREKMRTEGGNEGGGREGRNNNDASTAVDPTGDLARDGEWLGSNFGEFQEYIFDFLGIKETRGGKNAEANRLKMSTPLTLGAAMLDAFQEELDDDLAQAKIDLQGVEENMTRVEAYVRDARRDASLRSTRVSRIIEGARDRANELIDDTLQISNAQNLMRGYLLSDPSGNNTSSSSSMGNLFKGGVVGAAVDNVKDTVADYAEWMEGVASEQEERMRGDLHRLRNVPEIAEAIASYQPSSSSSSSGMEENGDDDAAHDDVAPDSSIITEVPRLEEEVGIEEEEEEGEEEEELTKSALEIVDEFSVEAAERLLQQEFREATSETVLTVAVGAIAGFVFAAFLPEGFQSTGVLFAALGGYAGQLNFPLKRFEAKSKAKTVSDSFSNKVQRAMMREAEESISAHEAQSSSVLLPARDVISAKISGIEAAARQRESLSCEVEDMLERVSKM